MPDRTAARHFSTNSDQGVAAALTPLDEDEEEADDGDVAGVDEEPVEDPEDEDVDDESLDEDSDFFAAGASAGFSPLAPPDRESLR